MTEELRYIPGKYKNYFLQIIWRETRGLHDECWDMGWGFLSKGHEAYRSFLARDEVTNMWSYVFTFLDFLIARENTGTNIEVIMEGIRQFFSFASFLCTSFFIYTTHFTN
jgi:hypothetical protein